MAELCWRDNIAGREAVFPWPVPETFAARPAPMSKETVAGRAALFTDVLVDQSVAICLMYPGGARFARISPETSWALEERREGTTPPEIADEMDSVWRETIDVFAARNRELREQRASATPQQDPGEGRR